MGEGGKSCGRRGIWPLSVFFVSLVAINQHPSPGSHTPLELNMELGSYKHAAQRIIAKKSMKYYKFSASRLAAVQTTYQPQVFAALASLGVC